MNKNLSKDCKISRVLNAVAAGTSAQQSSILDMAGYDGVVFVALLGDVLDTCVLTLTPQENTVNSGAGMTAVTGGATSPFTANATTADNKLLVTDTYRPIKQFVRVELTRTTANAVIDGVIAIQYRGTVAPVTQPAEVIASAFVVGT